MELCCTCQTTRYLFPLAHFQLNASMLIVSQLSGDSQKKRNYSNGTQPSLASTQNRRGTAPKPPVTSAPVAEVPDHERASLEGLLGTATVDQLVDLDKAIQSGGTQRSTSVEIPAGLTREQRTNTHQVSPICPSVISCGSFCAVRADQLQEIRRIFMSRISTETDKAGVIIAKPMGKSTYHTNGGRWRDRNSQQVGFTALGGEYLHFTLFKVNKDTMDAINQIARQLRVKANAFGFAGTKDRRAATVQRVSIRYQRAEDVKWINDQNAGFKVGDFEHHTYPITLGQHGGNEFVITLKNAFVARGVGCALPRQIELVEQAVEVALTQIEKHGFINYFGMQRFGTHTIGTHEVGIKILKGDFQGAVDAILHVDSHTLPAPTQQYGKDRPGNNDDSARFQAIQAFKMHNDVQAALKLLPRRFSAEYNIIHHLGQPSCANDYCNALLTVTRGLRMLYIHAYQAFIWNHATSYRWATFGSKVMVGDLVLENIGESQQPAHSGGDERDEDQNDELYNAKAHVLTAEDVASGRYTIFDIVLPTPGYDIFYPENAVGQFYKDFMARPENGGLDPYDMRRKQKEFSLGGNYRYVVGRFIKSPGFSVCTYADDVEQLYPTDDDYIKERHRQKINEARRQTIHRNIATIVDPAKVDNINAWGSFAANAAKHDAQELADEKSEAVLQPKSEAPTIHDTFNRIEVDDAGKRIQMKEEKYTHVFPTVSVPAPINQAATKPGDAVMTFTTDAGGDWDKPTIMSPDVEDMGSAADGLGRPLNTHGVKRTASVAGLSTGAESGDGSEKRQDRRMISDITNSASDQAAGVASAARSHASYSPLSHETHPDKPAPATMQGFEGTGPSSSGPLSPNKEHGVILTGKDHAPAPPSQASQVPTVNGIPVPTFRVIGNEFPPPVAQEAQGLPSPKTESFAKDVSAADTASKIAVVLKFSLRNSNYATIVLREIMAAVTPPPTENRPSSRPGSS
jgi:tRNA pseudouridine13 synthase